MNGSFVLLNNLFLFSFETCLLTNIDKKRKEKTKIHQLSDAKVIHRHKEEQPSVSPGAHMLPTRILCVPEVDGVRDWNRFALSNFIYPRR